MDFTLRKATLDDAPQLALMNRQLIADEGSRNPMSLRELNARMHALLENNWMAVLILSADKVAGYVLYQERRDEYDPTLATVYVRQFFIAPERRSQGFGAVAFEQIAREYFPRGANLSLEVLTTNPRGLAFWEHIGFAPYSVSLQRAGK